MPKHVTIKVAGKVQGVFFRASTRDIANQLNISGLVRNEPDGSVYIEAEGEDESLQKFIEWCKHGPKHAQVMECHIQEDKLKSFKDFVIER